MLLPFASALCAVPATIIGVPADVLKKRLVLGVDKDVASAIRNAVARNNGGGLFAGWHVNLIKDIPFAGVKIGLYEIFVQYYQHFYNQQQQQHQDNTITKTTINSSNNKISSMGASICGIASGVSCAILTCPLDVVNTRIKADLTASHSTSIRTVALEILEKEGVRALFRGVVMRSVVLGIGSSIFWPIQHSVAHSLQASYEADNRMTTPSFMG
jgi:solute carrier family 25 (mitochondrial S-adenosylmethionine transporter), member 26